MLGLQIDLDLKSHGIIDINAGYSVKDNNQAHIIPNPTVAPYPAMEVMGDDTIVRKAAVVVREGRNTGNMS